VFLSDLILAVGNKTSGQVLVWHDMLGLYPNFKPKFCKQYLNLSEQIKNALIQFKNEVQNRSFPSKENTYSISQEEWDKFISQKKHQLPNTTTILKSNDQEQKIEKQNALKTSNSNVQILDGTLTVDGDYTSLLSNSFNGMNSATFDNFNISLSEGQKNSQSTKDGDNYGEKPPLWFSLGTRTRTTKNNIGHDSTQSKNICLIGGGAMGSLFAARLAVPLPDSLTSSNTTNATHNKETIHYEKKLDKTFTPTNGTGHLNKEIKLTTRERAISRHNIWIVSSWKEHVETINKYGIKIENLDNSEQIVTNVKATSHAEEVVDMLGPTDLCIVLVKSPFTRYRKVMIVHFVH
jgi:3-methyl-2-oxobutanoate hydroxymethyltransferase